MAYFDCIVGGSGKGNTLVVTCADDLAGATITCTDGTKTYRKTCPSTSPYEVTFYGLAAGTYTVSATVSGNTYTTTVVITDYEAELGGFNWKTWVDLSENYTSSDFTDLDDLLSDETAIRELMTIHACVDYLAGIAAESADVETIIGNDLCAKWINLRDYALDTLYANIIIKGYIDTADKYFYGEWALVNQVPTMTSNTTPYGEAFSTTTHSSGPAYYAFTNDSSASYVGTSNGASAGEYVGYHHIKPVSVKKATASFFAYRGYYSTVALQGSHDNSTWNDISEEVEISSPSNPSGNSVINNVDFTITDFDAYEYHRIIRKANRPYTAGGDYDFFYVSVFKMYDWQPKGNVPVMTSNTAPYGEVFATSNRDAAYLVFDGNDSPSCVFNTNGTGTVGYKFTNPVCPKRFYLYAGAEHGGIYYKIQGSNTGNNDDWEDLTVEANSYPNSDFTGYGDIETSKYFLYLRAVIRSHSGSDWFAAYTLQFYGRELSVSVPKMTSNTAPYGEVIANNQAGNPAYYAFDGNDSTRWETQGLSMTSGIYIGYSFINSLLLRKVRIVTYKDNNTYPSFNIKIQASNDDFVNEIVDITNSITITNNAQKTIDISIESETLYKSYRVYFLSPTAIYQSLYYYNLCTIQFYGLDYSEKEFEAGTTKKWLYDHGVELETITISGTGTKGTDAIQLTAANAQAVATIDTTAYTLMRSKAGAHASGTNQLICGSGASNFTANNMPYNNGFDVSSVNGSNAVGVKQTANGIFDTTELWLE